MIDNVRAYLDIQRDLRLLSRRLFHDPDRPRVQVDVINLVLTWDRVNEDFRDDRTLLQDYVHFLMTRDKLSSVIEAASPATQAYIKSLVDPRDDLFRAFTNPVDPGLIRLFPKASAGWWWRVTPKELGQELRRQLTPGNGEGRPD